MTNLEAVASVCGAVLLAASICYAAKRHRQERARVGERPTIEREQRDAYAVAIHANHWNGVTTQPDFIDEHEGDIPYSLVEAMHRNSGTTM